MALMYCTLTEAKAQVNQSGTHDDTKLTAFIEAASGAVKNYLGDVSAYEPERDDDDAPIVDSAGLPIVDFDSNELSAVRAEVRQAVLILVALFYRDAEGAAQSMPGYLPDPVVSLLYPLRRPVSL
jgi:hypothetical protein